MRKARSRRSGFARQQSPSESLRQKEAEGQVGGLLDADAGHDEDGFDWDGGVEDP